MTNGYYWIFVDRKWQVVLIEEDYIRPFDWGTAVKIEDFRDQNPDVRFVKIEEPTNLEAT